MIVLLFTTSFIFFLPPMVVAIVVEYLFCRFPKHTWWRWVPPGVSVALGLIVTVFRFYEWGEGPMPLDGLIMIPGLPVLGLLAGCYVGWRLWKWYWRPRVK